MTTRDRPGVVATYQAVGHPGGDPLDPINPSTLMADRAVVMEKAVSLLRYHTYLASARHAKAKRKRVSLAFERNVLAQARLAQDDLKQFTTAALRTTQQINHTAFWSEGLARLTETLRRTGPVTVRSMWDEIASNETYASALATRGLLPELKAAISEVVAKVDITVAQGDGKISIETLVAGESVPRRAWLSAAADPPSSIGDLLRRSQFERVVSAFTNNDPVYMEVVSGGSSEIEPADAVACGAVAAGQLMAEHVRKLEDTGLATYQGEDPFSIGALVLVAAIFLAALGAGITYLCEHPTDQVQQPEWVCTAGAIMVFIGIMLLTGGLAAMAGPGVFLAFIASFGISLLVTMLIDELSESFP
jgi:hypothetical protein